MRRCKPAAELGAGGLAIVRHHAQSPVQEARTIGRDVAAIRGALATARAKTYEQILALRLAGLDLVKQAAWRTHEQAAAHSLNKSGSLNTVVHVIETQCRLEGLLPRPVGTGEELKAEQKMTIIFETHDPETGVVRRMTPQEAVGVYDASQLIRGADELRAAGVLPAPAGIAPAPLDDSLFNRYYQVDVVDEDAPRLGYGGPDGPSAEDRGDG